MKPKKHTIKSADIIIIGGGSAGYAAARTALAGGAKVVVIEGGRDLGGLCILRGCMPTKALLESSHRWHEIKRAGMFGLKVNPIGPDWKAIQRRKSRLIDDFASYRVKQLMNPKLQLHRGNAKFLDNRHIEVDDGSGIQVYTAKAFIIATGSRIQMPSVAGLSEAGCWSSDDALNLRQQPKSLIVLGGGAIACEFAQFFAHLGTKVTQVQRSAHILRDFDPDVSLELATRFRKDGIRLYTGTELMDVAPSKAGRRVRFRHGEQVHSVTAEGVLCALGRAPATDSLSLPNAGVRLKSGAVEVDLTMSSSTPHIFAAGDVTGLYEVVHIAIQQGEVAATNALRVLGISKAPEQKMDYRLKTSVVFTDPEVAHVGLTEAEATAQGLEYKTAMHPFADHGKSMIHGCEEGFVKLMADPSSGEILGASIVGPSASDLIHELIAVMHYRGTVQELARMPHYHPTLAEIVTYPAEELSGI